MLREAAVNVGGHAGVQRPVIGQDDVDAPVARHEQNGTSNRLAARALPNESLAESVNGFMMAPKMAVQFLQRWWTPKFFSYLARILGSGGNIDD